MPRHIVIKGARVHNLKNIDLEIPRDRLVVITGVSGSGKSSLAFDTLYAEGQRRYVESLSAYARQFLEQRSRPDVDSIEGLSPAISIEQKNTSHNPRSTVGTATEIYDYLRLLFARIGKPLCTSCGREISAQTIQQVVDQLRSLTPETRLLILAPIAVRRTGEYQEKFRTLSKAGFVRVKVDGMIHELDKEIPLKRDSPHDVDLVVDRLVVKPGVEKRLADSLEVASRYGKDVIKVEASRGNVHPQVENLLFSQRFACVHCGISYPEISPRLFSFNSPVGACSKCNGLGIEMEHGARHGGAWLFSQPRACQTCNGTRLKRESRQVKISRMSIADLCSLPVHESLRFFTSLDLSPQEETIANPVLQEIASRLNFLVRVGLDYVSLDRTATTLSGGEAQRIRLATQIGSGLAGVLYILDEPTIGLHPRDNTRLLAILKNLRDLGNTILVVEHDRDTIEQADYVIDMGPGAGVHGGEAVAYGTPEEIRDHRESLTGQYLSARKTIPTPAHRRVGSGTSLTIKGARLNNLKDITVDFPVGAMSCVTGVSGSGKSSLVVDTLYKAMAPRSAGSKSKARAFDEIVGQQHFDRTINITQSPIGRTPRSNPATFTGLLDDIRKLFSQLPAARVRGYGSGRFSFNAKGGRCEACFGDGILRIEMHFLPDVFVTCEVCGGRRYNRETLEILYKGRSIADVLDLTVNQALEFMTNVPAARHKLQTLADVGLGYIRLGQSATTLSGGEAQRIKLARELSKKSTGKTLFILDEPTTGLHFDDVRKLIEVLDRITEAGNTIIMIEHNLDVVKCADYIVDLGPEGGDLGGRVVTQGVPEAVASTAESYTGELLRPLLAESKT